MDLIVLNASLLKTTLANRKIRNKTINLKRESEYTKIIIR